MQVEVMRQIMLVFTSQKTALKIKSALTEAGLPVHQVFSAGMPLLQQAVLSEEGGVVILQPNLPDIGVPDLLTRLPDTFDLLVLQNNIQRADYGRLPGLFFLDAPFTGPVLTDGVSNLLHNRSLSGFSGLYGANGDHTAIPAHQQRSAAEKQLLDAAKRRLIDGHQMTESQAHRYLQRRSMETGVNLVGIARRVLENGLA
ncbi:MAG TPA: hypothetical protein DD640_09265 [Clostridiales bacterium]|nr:hypothetical protein [Clostridiales bacterium]